MTTGGMTIPDEPVGDVDVGGEVFGGGVLLEDGADGDGDARSSRAGRVGNCQGREFPAPGVKGIDVGEGDDFSAGEDGKAVGVELGLPSRGEPEVARHEAGADEGGLLGFDEGDGLVGVQRQEVLAKEALGEGPVGRQLSGPLHEGVDPGDAAGGVLVFDAMAGVGVVFHHFAGATAALLVDLEVDDVACTGDAEAVCVDEAFDDEGVEDGVEEGDEGGVVGGADAAGDDGGWDGEEILRLRLRMTGGGGRMTGGGGGMTEGGMVVEVLSGGVVVAAGGFVVAAADGGVEGLPCFVDVQGEAALASASRTSMAGGDPAILLQGIHQEKRCFASTASILS